MRILVVITVLCISAFSAFAQSPAADKDAVDLSAKMDTLAKWNDSSDIFSNLNVGLKNTDLWEDFEIGTYYGSTNHGVLRFGGPLIFNALTNAAVSGVPNLSADLNGDGISDLVVDNFWWYKGKKEYPYFDSAANAAFVFHDFPVRITIGSVDYDGDGYNDVLIATDNRPMAIFLYPGFPDVGKTGAIFPSDSLFVAIRPTLWRGGAIAKFGKNLPYQIIFGWYKDNGGNGDYRIGFIQHKGDLHEDTTIWLSYSDSGGISVQNLYATDITGDGIPDLLVSDGLNVYIFKGGDDFGTYPLTPAHAFYRIKSPRLLDFGNFGFVKNFGVSMYSCGDLSGSGIPYVAIDAYVDEATLYKGYTFIYAGGKALDSLFDAILGYDNQGATVMDTLHSVDSSNRTASLVVLGDANGTHNYSLLLHRGSDQIPHKTNPQMLTALNAVGRLPVLLQARSGGGYVDIVIDGESSGEHRLAIYNMLGAKVAERDLGYIGGKETQQFDTKDFASGTYIAVLQGREGAVSVKFPVSRTINEQAPESLLIWEMHETIPALNGLR